MCVDACSHVHVDIILAACGCLRSAEILLIPLEQGRAIY